MPRWIRILCLRWANNPSQWFVVFGMKLSLNVNRKGRLVLSDLYALRILWWVYRHLPVPSWVFSIKKQLYFSCQPIKSASKIFILVLVIFIAIFRSSRAASVFALMGIYRLMIWIWWNWHIWIGIPGYFLARSCLIPGLPSITKPLNLYPIHSNWYKHFSYSKTLSDSISCQYRTFFGLLANKIP